MKLRQFRSFGTREIDVNGKLEKEVAWHERLQYSVDDVTWQDIPYVVDDAGLVQAEQAVVDSKKPGIE